MPTLMHEHEQILSKSAPDNQPEEQASIVKQIKQLFYRSKRFRKRYDFNWHYNYEFVIGGRQWPQERPRWRFNEAVNITWASIMTEIAIQTDGRPKFEYSSAGDDDIAFANALKSINDQNWKKYNWNGIVQDALFDCKLYHVGHTIVDWDENAQNGLGDPSLEQLDPFYCYWDPYAHDLNIGKRRARHFIYAEPIPTSMLKLRYPDQAKDIKPDVEKYDQKADYGVYESRIYTNFDPYNPTRLPAASQAEGETWGGEDMTLLLRVWLRDDTLEQVEVELQEKDEDGNPMKEYQLKKKYPFGRYVEMANNRILHDDVNGVWRERAGQRYWAPLYMDKFPIARCVNYRYSREYAGENEVTHTRGLNKIVNYVYSYILDSFKMASNPKHIVGSNGNIEIDRITNEPGLVIETDDMSSYRQEPGQPIAPGSFNLLDVSRQLFDTIQGLQDVSRGADVSNVNSAIMLEGYVEAAQTRPRMKNRNLELYLTDLGQILVQFYLQFYDQMRVYRYTNEEGFPETVQFMSQDGKVTIQRTVKHPQQGNITIDNVQNQEVKGIPDVSVVSGSALPFAKAQKANMALTYFNAGAIDDEELLKAVDWPNFEEVLKRVKEKQQAAAEAEMAMKQGAPA